MNDSVGDDTCAVLQAYRLDILSLEVHRCNYAGHSYSCLSQCLSKSGRLGWGHDYDYKQLYVEGDGS